MIDATYTHFAIRISTGKIINGWDYRDTDPADIRMFSKIDLKDMDVDITDAKVLSKNRVKKTIDPFDNNNWEKPGEIVKIR